MRKPLAGQRTTSRGSVGSSSLKPVLGLTELVFYGVGVIVGAGVYSVIGVAAGLAQDGLWISFALAAVVALLTALSYAELAAAYPEAGAEYVYVRKAWPQVGWLPYGVGVILAFGGVATTATVARAFGGYLGAFAGVPPGWASLALVIIATAIAARGLKESSAVNIVFTTIEVSGLIAVIAIGFSHESRTPVATGGEASILAAAALLFFVYLGFEETANLAEEASNSARDLPAAILLCVVVTTILYVLTALAVLRIAAPAQLAESDAPLATAVGAALPSAAVAMAAIGVFATANTVLVAVIATSRLIFAMGRDGELPTPLGRLSGERRAPLRALLLVLIASAGLIAVGGVRILAEISSFSALLAFLLVNLCVIALRFREPLRRRPFRIPFAIRRTPAAPVAAIASIAVFSTQFSWKTYAIGAACSLLAGLAYALRPRRTQSFEQGRPEPGAASLAEAGVKSTNRLIW